MKRREFLSAAAMGTVATMARSAAVIPQRAARPVVVASVNGYFFKNGGPKTVIETAWEMMTRGSDVLDAVIAVDRQIGRQVGPRGQQVVAALGGRLANRLGGAGSGGEEKGDNGHDRRRSPAEHDRLPR